MQKNTTEWHIKRANELSLQINTSPERPTASLAEWHRIVNWLDQYGGRPNWRESVNAIINW